MIIELSQCGACSIIHEINDGNFEDFETDILDCTKSGDTEDSCKYILTRYNPAFRIVKMLDGRYRNVVASFRDKQELCESIYFDSDTDFSDTDNSELYLIWESAHQFRNDQPEN